MNKFTIEDVRCSVVKAPTITVLPKAYYHVLQLMAAAGKREWGAYGITRVATSGDYEVLGLCIPKQTRSTSHTHTEFPDEIHARLVKKGLGLWAMIHSHHSLGLKGFSGIDEANSILTNKISLVFSWENGVEGRADSLTPCGKPISVDAVVFLPAGLSSVLEKKTSASIQATTTPALVVGGPATTAYLGVREPLDEVQRHGAGPTTMLSGVIWAKLSGGGWVSESGLTTKKDDPLAKRLNRLLDRQRRGNLELGSTVNAEGVEYTWLGAVEGWKLRGGSLYRDYVGLE